MGRRSTCCSRAHPDPAPVGERTAAAVGARHRGDAGPGAGNRAASASSFFRHAWTASGRPLAPGVADRGVYGIVIDYQNMPLMQPAALSRPTATQIGAFANLRLVGRGGMSDIYRGDHPTLGRPVAIK